MKNLIDVISKDMARHKVPVRLPGTEKVEELALVEVTALTSVLKDFESTFGEALTSLHCKMAKRVFGEAETSNTYGVFVDDESQMLFAFNREFAGYDKKKKSVVFLDPDEILSNRIPTPAPTRPPKVNRPPNNGTSIAYRYAIISKK